MLKRGEVHGRPPVRALLVLIGLAACAPPYRVETLEPGFDGTRTYHMRGNLVESSPPGAVPLELNLVRIDSLGKEARFLARVEYQGVNELRIRSGMPLIIVADGDSIKLPPYPGALRTRAVEGSRLLEQADYSADTAQVRRVARGQRVEVVVPGAVRSERRTLSAANLANLRDFVARFVDVNPTPRRRQRAPAADTASERGLRR